MEKTLSYHSDKKLKSSMVKEMENHRKQDSFIKGSYGKLNGSFHGCSVGCAVHSLNRIKGITLPYDNHGELASAIGIPEWLWRLNDSLFENLPDGDNSKFSVDFLRAIPVGVNLEPVKWKFVSFILKENIERVLLLKIPDELKEQVVSAVRGCLALYENALKTGVYDEGAAWSAESAAESAAWSAARSAAYKRYADELLRLLREAK